MTSIFTFRRSDEFVPNFKLNSATALDCSCTGEFLIVVDSNEFIHLNIENERVERRERPNHKVVRILKCNPKNSTAYAAITSSCVEFWQDSVPTATIAKTTRISDFDFDHFNENCSVVSTTESVTLLDSRVPKQLTSCLPVLFGANQAKFSAAEEHKLFLANVSDIRCFDIRNTKAPCKQFIASNNEKQILSMELHPTDINILVTSSSNESKFWNCLNETNNQLLDHSNIGKFAFSKNGEVFVGLNYPAVTKNETTIKLWQISSTDNNKKELCHNAKELRHNATDFIDFCWQKKSSQNHYLFTLTKKDRIFKHLVVPNIQSETKTIVPIKQTVEDEKLDRLILIGANKSHQQLVASKSKPQTEELKSRQEPFHVDSTITSWKCWIRAPNLNGQDLLFELNSLKKLNVNGLTYSEVNYERIAIAILYSHYTIYKKIIIEIRFHRNFIENGLIFLELLKKDSPLNSQTAKLLLSHLNEEANRQRSNACTSTSIFALALRQLPSIVDSIHIFPPINSEALEQSRISLVNDESECSKSDKVVGYSTDKESQCSIGYATSPFDAFVPSPRLCGARFNQNGFLCLFGQIECMFRLSHPIDIKEEKIESNEEITSRSARIARRLLNRNNKSAFRMNSPQTELPKRSTRLLFNKNEFNQHTSMKDLRTLSDYYSHATQFMMERNLHDLPEMNNSFTVFNPEVRSRIESERQRVSSVTLEEPASISTSMIKTSKSNTVPSPIRGRRRFSSTTSVTTENFQVESQSNNLITVLDTTVFQNVSRLLGQHLRIFGGSVSQICYHNMWQCVRHSPKRELISLWQILFEFFNAEEEHQMNIINDNGGDYRLSGEKARLTKKQSKNKNSNKRISNLKNSQIFSPISFHPLDCQFMYYFIDYYYAKFDIQTSALLACVLIRSRDSRDEHEIKPKQLISSQPSMNLANKFAAYDKFIPLFKTKENDPIAEQIYLNKKMREPRSYRRQADPNYSDNSNGNSFEQPHNYFINNKPDINTKMIEPLELKPTKDLQVSNSYEPYLTLENQPNVYRKNSILDERIEAICMEYSVILYQWNLLNQRAELLKCTKMDSKDAHFKQLIQCAFCNENTENGFCNNCESGAMVCMVCDQKCNGLVTVCKICAHGGHGSHVLEYFSVFDSCPICGCRCKN